MKNFKKVMLLLLCNSLILLSCKKEVKNSAITNINNSNTKKIKTGVSERKTKIIPIQNQAERKKYTFNLQVEKGLKHSYIDSRNLNLIQLRIAVPNEKFEIINTYNISTKNKGIVVVISDKTTNKYCGEPITHILETKLLASQIKNPLYPNQKLILNKKDSLTVFVINENNFEVTGFGILAKLTNQLNSPTNFICRELIIRIKNKNGNGILTPKESGGGVIIPMP